MPGNNQGKTVGQGNSVPTELISHIEVNHNPTESQPTAVVLSKVTQDGCGRHPSQSPALTFTVSTDWDIPELKLNAEENPPVPQPSTLPPSHPKTTSLWSSVHTLFKSDSKDRPDSPYGKLISHQHLTQADHNLLDTGTEDFPNISP